MWPVTSLPDYKILDWAMLKVHCGMYWAQMMEFAFELVKHIVGQGENDGFYYFSSTGHRPASLFGPLSRPSSVR